MINYSQVMFEATVISFFFFFNNYRGFTKLCKLVPGLVKGSDCHSCLLQGSE